MSEDDAIKQMLDQHPLLRLDLYIDTQASACLEKGREIKAALDANIKTSPNGSTIENFSAMHREFWFWVLGAYEFSRTLSDQRAYFDQSTRDLLKENLTFFTFIRVPFAKLRQPGTEGKRTIAKGGYLSVTRISTEPTDMFFRVKVGSNEHEYGMRASIDAFESFLERINAAIRMLPTS